MMKLIHKLENSKAFWSLIWLSLIFFLLRLPSLIEPSWYTDEGIYQVIGRSLAHGQLLYVDIWDNKPPLLYLIYALFNGDQFATRITSLIFGTVTLWLFLLLSQALFKKIKISIITTSIFLLLFAIPLTEGNIANAENFMLLPIVAAALIIYKTIENYHHKTLSISYRLLLSGFLLGLAFLFKIVAIFDLVAFLVILTILFFPNKKEEKFKIDKVKIKKIFFIASSFVLGFLIPLGITLLYFLSNNALGDFFYAVFSRNIAYVAYENTFFIPQGLLIIKALLLLLFVLFILIKRSTLSSAAIFVLVWVAFSLFNALFSQRPYTHYILVIIPSFSLLIGIILSEQKKKLKKFFIVCLIAITITLFSNFVLTHVTRTLLYYQNAFLFVTGQRDVTQFQAFFDPNTPRDYQLAAFIKMKNRPNDPILIWGDSAQIYMLSQTKPITKYTVAYHIRQNENGFSLTQQALNKIRPRYVIILTEAPSFPFKLDGYVNTVSLEKAVIYERIF